VSDTSSEDSSQNLEDHWEIYMTYVDERPAVILVDVGISPAVPLPELSNLVWLWVYLKSPDDQGFPSADEDDALNELEDSVTEALEGFPVRHVGRVTTDGRREFYFYTNDTQSFHEIVTKVMESASDHQFEIDEAEDPEWSHYANVLFPTPEDFQQIANQHVIARLLDSGDSLDKPRPVDHFANFASETDRATFAVAAEAIGFEIVSQREREAEDLPYSLGMLRTHAVDEDTIDHITFELFELARKHNGEYDGWGAGIVK
jgi:uncharacterized protein (TIGR01619 family)